MFAILQTFVLCLAGLLVACSTTPPAYHTVYKLTACTSPVSREAVALALGQQGYLRHSVADQPYDIFKATKDSADEVAVAVCQTDAENYILIEKLGCKNGDKACVSAEHQAFRRIAEQWACQVSEKSARAESWTEAKEPDWTREPCAFIVRNLPL